VGTHSTKGRSEVWYTNKKPWRQKGTGRARAGTRRSPLWRGGGITFGPKPRDYSYSLPKKMKVRALRSALFAKFRDGEVIVVDGLKVEAPRTKHLVAILKKVGATGRCLIGTSGPEQDRNLVLSARNIPGVQCVPIQDFNTLDVLTAKTVILTREALARILEAGSPAKAAAPEGEVKA
jgi:large subunit ribosomal protein L4